MGPDLSCVWSSYHGHSAICVLCPKRRACWLLWCDRCRKPVCICGAHDFVFRRDEYLPGTITRR